MDKKELAQLFDNDRPFKGYSDDDLIGGFGEALSDLAKFIVKAALMAKEATARGLDLERHFSLKIVGEMRLIAAGKLHPEAYLHFLGNQLLRRSIAPLSLEVQQRLVSEPVDVAQQVKGQWTYRKQLAVDMYPEVIRQVFGDGKIRNCEEQMAFVARKKIDASLAPTEELGDLLLDYEKDGVWHDKHFFPSSVVEEAGKRLKKRRKIAIEAQ
jgi:hypothetical protein